jgi:chaperonin cofactor prefoldin
MTKKFLTPSEAKKLYKSLEREKERFMKNIDATQKMMKLLNQKIEELKKLKS